MENSIELCENVSVIPSDDTNNSEIESKTIEEENKTSEEVTANFSEIKKKEVKTLDTNKPFKWTNEATKAAACMLKDIIDQFNDANSDLSSSIDENIDPWGYEKLDKQIKTLVDMIVNKVDLFPEEWCRFKLVSIIEKYFGEHTKDVWNKYFSYDEYEPYFYDNKYSSTEYDFHYLYLVLAKNAVNNVYYRDIARRVVECCDEPNDINLYLEIGFNEACMGCMKTSEGIIVGNYLEGFYQKDTYHDENDKIQNLNKDLEKVRSIPKEFQQIYLEDLFRKNVEENFPTFKEIDEIKGFDFNSNKSYELMMALAHTAYVTIDFLNIADAFITGEISNLKGLKETYSSMFEE